MWWLVTLAVIAAVLIFAALMRIKLIVTFRDRGLRIFLKILFVKIEFTAEKNGKIKKSDFKIRKFRRRRDKVLKKYRLKKTEKKAVKKYAGKKPRSPLKTVRAIKEILWRPVTAFGKYLRIEKFDIRIKVGGEDAAKVAIDYGYIVQALQYLVTFLESFSSLKKTRDKKAEVNADFADGSWDASVDIRVSVAVWQTVSVAVKALCSFLRYKFSKASKTYKR